MDDTAHYLYSLIPYLRMPSFIICDGINSFMQSTMVLSIRSLIQSSLMYRDMQRCICRSRRLRHADLAVMQTVKINNDLSEEQIKKTKALTSRHDLSMPI